MDVSDWDMGLENHCTVVPERVDFAFGELIGQ